MNPSSSRANNHTRGRENFREHLFLMAYARPPGEIAGRTSVFFDVQSQQRPNFRWNRSALNLVAGGGLFFRGFFHLCVLGGGPPTGGFVRTPSMFPPPHSGGPDN